MLGCGGQRHTPGSFNGMVAPCPVRNQWNSVVSGESSIQGPAVRTHLFPMLVDSWRERWGDPDLKFYFVQLAGYDGRESGLRSIRLAAFTGRAAPPARPQEYRYGGSLSSGRFAQYSPAL